MKRFFLLLVFLACSFSVIAQSKPYVILISFDGFRWDYINRNITPNLEKVKTNGVSALSLKPSFPSKTFPNHQAIITGMYPSNHGIIANTFKDKFNNTQYRLGDSIAVTDAKWYLGEAFWETAERQGIVTASYFWPGSELKLDYRRPTYFEKYNHALPYEDRVNGIIDWLKLPNEKRPHFITSYFHETDDIGHEHGPNSNQITDAIIKLDNIAGMLISKLTEIKMIDSVDVIFLSDHGMTEVPEDKFINVETIIKDYNCKFLDEGVIMFIEPPKEKVQEVYNILKKNEKNFKTYYREEIPEHYHFNNNPLISTIVLIPDLGYSLFSQRGISRKMYSKGNHGYDNSHTDMHGFFVAMGPSFKNNYKTGTVWNIDIYPLLCKIFNIIPRSNIDGKLERIEFLLK